MARPNGIQKLKHGKFLTKANFPKFVETWNWLVTAFDAMTGDKQTNPHEGHIVLDRTNPDRPVIRWEGKEAEAAAAGIPRPFEIVEDEESPGTFKVVNCKIPCPIEVITCNDYTISGTNEIYIHVDLSGGRYNLTVNQTSRNNTATHAQFKIYEFDDETGEVNLDLRPMALPLFAT